MVGLHGSGGRRGQHRVGGLGPRAPFHVAAKWGYCVCPPPSDTRGLFLRCGTGGIPENRGGAAYDPARRVPRVSSYALPRTIDNERWCTAVVYYREFFWLATDPLTHFARSLARSLAWSVASGYDSGPGRRCALEP